MLTRKYLQLKVDKKLSIPEIAFTVVCSEICGKNGEEFAEKLSVFICLQALEN